MTTTLAYAIKFVAQMEQAVDFHQHQLGLNLRFQSPEWSEFETGGTTLALHLSSPEHPDGSYELGFRVADVDRFCAERRAAGVELIQEPRSVHGQRIAKLRYPDKSEFSVSGT